MFSWLPIIKPESIQLTWWNGIGLGASASQSFPSGSNVQPGLRPSKPGAGRGGRQ